MSPSLHLLFISLAIISASAAPTPASGSARPFVNNAQDPTDDAPAAKQAAASPLIEQMCKQTNQAETCVDALNKEAMAQKADARQLAAIVVRLAYQNGTETMGFLTGLLEAEKEHPPMTEKCLTDCAELYELALQQLDGATAALDEMVVDPTANEHATTWITAARAHVTTCEAGCEGAEEHRQAVSAKNEAISNLCLTAISMIAALPNSLD